MNTPSEENWDELRRLVLGLGEASTRKSHYPSLRQRLLELERFRSMVDIGADLLFVLDAESGEIIDLNATACERLGRVRTELIRTPFPELLHADARKALRRLLGDFDRCVRERSTLVSQLPSGADKSFPVEITVRCGAFGGSRYVVLAARDVTERRRAEKELRDSEAHLRRANEELQRFTSVVAHDLKAPLRAVHSLSSWIEDDVRDHLSEEARQQMQLLRARVRRMDALINALLDYSRAGGEVCNMEEVDTAALVAEVVGSLDVPEGFSVVPAPDLPHLFTDRLHLQQILANLIENAVKYHDRPDGRVTVSARDAGAFYEFSVTDDGPGIAPEHRRRVFEMFQRLDPTKSEGTGIGLAVVKKVVDKVGGRIALESSPGRGATFRFTWPKVM